MKMHQFTVTKKELNKLFPFIPSEISKLPDTITLKGTAVEEDPEVPFCIVCRKPTRRKDVCRCPERMANGNWINNPPRSKDILNIIYEKMESISAAGQGAVVDGISDKQFVYALEVLRRIADKIKNPKPQEEKRCCPQIYPAHKAEDCPYQPKDKPQPITN
jgi:hypothetical protein